MILCKTGPTEAEPGIPTTEATTEAGANQTTFGNYELYYFPQKTNFIF